MRGEILTIGDELISGRVLNLNGWYAAGRLTALGLSITNITTLGDDPAAISAALFVALGRSDFIIVSGGLGTTKDDITVEVVSRLLCCPLELQEPLLDHIKAVAAKWRVPWTPALEKLAWLPRGATIINPGGTTAGFALRYQGKPIFFLPGVPEEMRMLMDHHVIPFLLNLYPDRPTIARRTLKIFGPTEAWVGDMIQRLGNDLNDVIIGYYPNFPEIHLTITAHDKSPARAESALHQAEQAIMAQVGAFVFARDDETIESVVGDLLTKNSRTLAVAESCTGGLICHRLTGVPGSSAYFERGLVVYSNRAKEELLGVPHETIDTHGAVSHETALAMATGMRRVSGADVGLAVTGIAGPDGGTMDKPVGTVYFSLAAAGGDLTERRQFFGRRDQIKTLSAHTALDWVRRYLTDDSFLHRH
ncbi:MAG: competence/damage-inducible protein A [Deltaproteobacteria bacterium]|nr:competence/damage-inducible protein A [Deltaproteobacteria bacterium]